MNQEFPIRKKNGAVGTYALCVLNILKASIARCISENAFPGFQFDFIFKLISRSEISSYEKLYLLSDYFLISGPNINNNNNNNKTT